jgi:PAS domain S-box-containing protein
MKTKLSDLIDIPQFQNLQDRLNEIYSFPSAIIDNDGVILTATAWQDVCTQFHRKNEECEKHCIQSDKYILDHLNEANPAVSYKCPHGLVDNATPIIVDGIHYGNFFTGQLFLEPPDLDLFRVQAKKYGFDEEQYLDAVKRVPVWSQKQLDNYLVFIKGLIEIISESGLRNLKEIAVKKEIEETENRSKAILTQMSDGFWITDTKGKIIEVNEALCQMLGYGRDELLTMLISDIDNDRSSSDVRKKIKDIIKTGSEKFDACCKKKDGSLIYVETSVSFLASKNLIYGFHRDITERKKNEQIILNNQKAMQELLDDAKRSRRALLSVVEDQGKAEAKINQLNTELEQRVRDRTNQLELVNKELESFSYSVSHDLRAPLRAIDGYSLALKEDYIDKLDDNAIRYLDIVRNETQRMHQLINDLLKLSHVTSSNINFVTFNISEMVQTIVQRFELENQTHKVKFVIQSGLVANADPNLMEIVLTNLIGNAIKYSNKVSDPIIQFGQVTLDGKPVYYVRDNGVGFNMENAQKLFGAFQRLHRETEFEGTGVGLATVKRIINKHNGKIWADAKVNQGATFYFTLPGIY